MVQSIERGIEILRLLEAGPLGVTELANGTALPKTTVHRLLKTFEECKQRSETILEEMTVLEDDMAATRAKWNVEQE